MTIFVLYLSIDVIVKPETHERSRILTLLYFGFSHFLQFKFMKRHINIIFILIILNFENGISQLYIGPNLGIYTSRLIDPDLINQNFNIAHSINNKFKTNSLFAGMQFEYKFNNNFFLNISGDYTKMNVEATSSGFVPYKSD